MLSDVFFLLELEDMRIELKRTRSVLTKKTPECAAHLLLQLFVGVIDAELLEAVLLEVLESVDILHNHSKSGIFASDNV